MPDAPFNPLDKLNLAESLADAMLKRPVSPLPPTEKFDGAGVYAIYYSGDFSAYEPLARENRGDNPQKPIYVGKAVPPGARKGGFGLGRSEEHTSELQSHLNLVCRLLLEKK